MCCRCSRTIRAGPIEDCGGDDIEFRFEEEMSAIHELDSGAGGVVAESEGTAGREDLVVASPDRQDGHLR